MRLKLLLVGMIMFGGLLHAQDTIKTLVITEARIHEARYNYLELTNMGTETLDLHDWEIGRIAPWTDHYLPGDNVWVMLGDYLDTYLPGKDTLLEPGESFWVSVAYDFAAERHVKDPLQYGAAPDLIEQWDADIVFHMYEAPSGPTDSVSDSYQMMEAWNGRDCFYVRYHLPNGDSAAVDQVGGVWDGDPGDNGLGRNQDKAYDVAGVTDATATRHLVRKYTVKEGNLNFAEGRGLDLTDSEWIPIPHQRNWTGWSQGRKMYWTVGNHGNYNLDETTLTSSVLDVDWDNHIINVPWGVHNKDSVMMKFDYHPGLAWNYQLSGKGVTKDADPTAWEAAYVDSSYIGARTGDTLIVWACGDDMDEIRFHINVLPPTDDANVIVPKGQKDDEGWYGDWVGPVFEVTDGDPVIDTILDIPFATRTDTILKYFDKAPEADWEFVFVDDAEARADVKNGDLLRVTASDGSVKDYYLDVQPYIPSHNADLLSITWPDIPSYYKGVYGYVGDTIPNFTPQLFSYKAIVPSDIEGIPALVAKADDLNTKVEVDRAVNLFGSVADQTVTFTSTAEDDTTILVYSVQLVREKLDENIQPWEGAPFVSQFVWQDQWNNGFLEICNPGTEPMDLSDYMVMFQYTNDPNTIITWNSGVDDYAGRYVKYIPGYKWVSEADWAVTPGVCEQDIAINPIVQPGDVFTLGSIRSSGTAEGYDPNWWVFDQLDIDFKHNPWGEETGDTWGTQWINASWFMFRILNDSIKAGLKPANDPEDFEVVEAWATAEGGNWIIGGVDGNADNQCVTWIRKPQYYTGNPDNAGSWGNTVNNEGVKIQDGTSEWYRYDRHYGILQGYGWPFDILYITTDLGVHYMYEVTEYMSTVSSSMYKISEGYSMDELIYSLKDGITVDQFLVDINKKDDNQVLVIKSNGVELAGDAVVSDGDSLVVVSANGDNTSRYLLQVTAEGLSSDVALTSTTYTVDVNAATVSGFPYGTLLKSVVNGVTLPTGARMDVVDENGAYVALQKLNFDTIYVETQVSDQIFFVVTAEDGQTQLSYQLMPDATESDAFVVSEVYEVDQDNNLISVIPEGTAVSAFYANLTPAAGATMQLKDKFGLDRMVGNLYLDDKLTVVAADGVTQKTYYLALQDILVTYLAYVTSNDYLVNQVDLHIEGIPLGDLNEQTTVAEFKAALDPAPSATLAVYDAEGNMKADTDDLDGGDYLVVTAGNGSTVTTYTINVDASSVENVFGNAFKVYPNPSAGTFNIEGVTAGQRIRVYNASGAEVINRMVVDSKEIISLENQSRGFYIMTVSNDQGVVEHFKLIVE